MGIAPVAPEPGNIHSFNRYAYGNNNPLKYTDPDGRRSTTIINNFGVTPSRNGAVPYVPPVRYSGGRDANGRGIGWRLSQNNIPIIEPMSSAEMARLSQPKPSFGLKHPPTVGGGASLSNISPNDALRIQNAANRTNVEITVVGSRAAGIPNGLSDWDYVVPPNTPSRTIHSIKSSVPQGFRALGEPRNQDFFRSTVDKNAPHITFHPQGK